MNGFGQHSRKHSGHHTFHPARRGKIGYGLIGVLQLRAQPLRFKALLSAMSESFQDCAIC
jgi:hypothetical protein